MIANYHTHTPRCHHAEGSEEEHARYALKAGLQTLGFSDHTPYPFQNGYYSGMRMFPEELPEYISAVQAVRDKYAGQLKIHLGLEVEYYPAYFGELLQWIRDTEVEYLLLGQHWLGNEQGEPYSGSPTEDEHRLARYCDQVIEAMHTGVFTYLAHPDVLHFVGDGKVYDRHMRRICQTAKQLGMPLEVNLVGVAAKRHYPSERFWALAAEEGCQTVLGRDAHSPQAFLNSDAENKALALVKRFGLELLQDIRLVKP